MFSGFKSRCKIHSCKLWDLCIIAAIYFKTSSVVYRSNLAYLTLFTESQIQWSDTVI